MPRRSEERVPAVQPLASDDPQHIGPHQLLARIGAGGMGKVYLARTPDGHLCALKVVKEDLAHDIQFRARFAREIRTAQRVRGPFTPSVVDADPDAAAPWMATEYVPGPTLKEAVNANGPFPEPPLLVLALGLARALGAIHAVGLMHRDLKPSNILLSPRGPQVIDFGIARAVEGTVLTRTGQTFGTPAYTSPEQIVGQDVSPRSDLFSMAGAVLFAAGGEPPFGTGPATTTLHRVMSGEPRLEAVPRGVLRDVLTRCFAKDPAERPDVEEVRRELSALPLPPAEHGWLPSPVTEQIDARAGEIRGAEEAERTTTVPTTRQPAAPRPPNDGPDSFPAAAPTGSATTTGAATTTARPWWRRRATVVTAAASALVIAGGTAFALTALTDRGGEPPPAAGSPAEPSADPGTGPSGGDPSGDPSGTPDADDFGLQGWIYDLGFSEDGETLYVFGASGLSLWDWRNSELLHVFSPAPDAADVLPNGRVVGTYLYNANQIRVWDGDSGNELIRFGNADNDDRGFYDMPALTSDGSRVAVLAAENGNPREDRVIQVWDVETGVPGVEMRVDGPLTALEYTPDDAYLVGAAMDHEFDQHLGVSVWDPGTGEELHRFEGEDDYRFALSPDSRTMVLVSGEKRAEIVDLATGEVTRTLDEPSAEHETITGVGFSADGSLIYAGEYGYADDLGSVWDTSTGGLVHDAEVPVYSPMAPHPDGEHLATVADGGGRVLVLDSAYTTVTELT